VFSQLPRCLGPLEHKSQGPHARACPACVRERHTLLRLKLAVGRSGLRRRTLPEAGWRTSDLMRPRLLYSSTPRLIDLSTYRLIDLSERDFSINMISMPESPIPHIQIFILCRDRPHTIRECLKSALEQKIGHFTIEIIVSDNSQTSNVFNIVSQEFPQVSLRRRVPYTDAKTHFNTILSEVTGEYCILFHDDDVLNPEYVKTVVGEFTTHPNAIAIGTNAHIIAASGRICGKSHSFREKQIFSTSRDFLSKYIPTKREQRGIAPFPSYIYRKHAALNRFGEFDECGKYSDVVFLANLIKLGTIVWLPECLMKYRTHEGNDSNEIDISAYRKLWLNMRKLGVDCFDSDFKIWRKQVLMKWYMNKVRTRTNEILPSPRTSQEKIAHKCYLQINQPVYSRTKTKYFVRRIILAAIQIWMVLGYGKYKAKKFLA
jgi:glycosyltransferase involved in cell wall biosynthesis